MINHLQWEAIPFYVNLFGLFQGSVVLKSEINLNCYLFSTHYANCFQYFWIVVNCFGQNQGVVIMLTDPYCPLQRHIYVSALPHFRTLQRKIICRSRNQQLTLFGSTFINLILSTMRLTLGKYAFCRKPSV